MLSSRGLPWEDIRKFGGSFLKYERSLEDLRIDGAIRLSILLRKD